MTNQEMAEQFDVIWNGAMEKPHREKFLQRPSPRPVETLPPGGRCEETNTDKIRRFVLARPEIVHTTRSVAGALHLHPNEVSVVMGRLVRIGAIEASTKIRGSLHGGSVFVYRVVGSAA